eukprot:m.175012 g.175012  ORF g.175012 m.175012 type:complete len:54 (-) comp14605_c0_seq1:671-832(-)
MQECSWVCELMKQTLMMPRMFEPPTLLLGQAMESGYTTQPTSRHAPIDALVSG